jgi:hypothetical protein
MKYYTQHDIALGRLRLKIGKAVEPELVAAILGYGVKMEGPTGPGGVSVPAMVGPDAAVEQLRRVGPAPAPSLAERATSARLPGRATARRILGVLGEEPVAEIVRNEAGQIYLKWRGGKTVADFLGAKLYTPTVGPGPADATGVPPARVVYQRHLAVPGYWEDITQEQWEKAPQSDTRVLYTSTAGPVDKHLNGGW